MMGDDILTTALLDRLLHHSHVFSFNGDSYRVKNQKKEVYFFYSLMENYFPKPGEFYLPFASDQSKNKFYDYCGGILNEIGRNRNIL